MGSRRRRRTQPDQVTYPQKGAEKIQTGTTTKKKLSLGLLCPTDAAMMSFPITTGARNVVFKEQHVGRKQK